MKEVRGTQLGVRDSLAEGAAGVKGPKEGVFLTRSNSKKESRVAGASTGRRGTQRRGGVERGLIASNRGGLSCGIQGAAAAIVWQGQGVGFLQGWGGWGRWGNDG